MLTESEIIKEIKLGEDSTRQFKQKITKATQIADELCAMSNSVGGKILIGIADNLIVSGLNNEEINTYNQWIAAVANELLKPAIYPQTQIIAIEDKKIIVVYVSEGTSKPYCTQEGIYWVKSGSDKRKASPNELLRLFQSSALFFIDESTTNVSTDEINETKFSIFFEKFFGNSIVTTGLSLGKVLENMNLSKNNKLTFAGLLFFSKNLQKHKPYCMIKAVSYYENKISDDRFIAKKECIGTIEEQYESAITFLKNNLSYKQNGNSFNETGTLEISEKALEESLVNALIHRDYSKNAVIRVFVFKDRVEIVSPGSLPNHLTVENIKNGNSVMRNPLIASFAAKNILPYSGLGSGIPRILKNHPETMLINDVDGEQFIITLKRK